ncbi:M50 family metallopeptidase [Erythrobacter litoralis]|uniref:M50 family metallopeptidase n=1 Tax=Erythrobacter litoralis TaxID=39960 RepID=UPI0024358790|nr:M50 family metallopeptidase [Erythrobacter litoralis]
MSRWNKGSGWGGGKSARKEITTLIVIAVVTIILWHSPYGGYLLYPFTILSTWFHEMGHGLATMLFGHRFERLVIFPNGSGYALHLSPDPLSRISIAAISAAGLLGPTIAGCLLILSSRTARNTKLALYVLAGALLLSTVVWVRSMVGWLVLPFVGLACLLLAFRGRMGTQRFAVQFLGVQGCISIYRDFGYLFSPGGVLGGVPQLSDTAQIEQALLLPYWFWGGVITVLIAGMVWWALKRAHR